MVHRRPSPITVPTAMQGSLSDGISYFTRGIRMLRHPGVRPFVIVPLVVNVLIFASLIYLVVDFLSGALAAGMNEAPDWLSRLDWLIWPIVAIALALITGYLFTAVAILIASPFNGLLAEKVEEIVTGQAVRGPEGIRGALMSFPRAVARELEKLLYYLPLFLLVLVMSWIPPFSAVAPALWLLLGAWTMAVQYVDYPMDNHLLSLRELKDVLRERRLSSLGFGGIVALVSGIPVLNFFVVPAAVCGATLFWCEELSREMESGSSNLSDPG